MLPGAVACCQLLLYPQPSATLHSQRPSAAMLPAATSLGCTLANCRPQASGQYPFPNSHLYCSSGKNSGSQQPWAAASFLPAKQFPAASCHLLFLLHCPAATCTSSP
ncbi:hypothetical protein AAC387_Pa02g2136 [Persea americana]